MPDGSLPMLIGAGVLVLAIFATIMTYVRNYVKVPLDMVAIFSGIGEAKVVRGGGKFRVPGLQRVDFMSLEPFSVPVVVRNVLSRDNVPVNIDCMGLVGFGVSNEAIQTAAQRYLTASKDRAKILEQVKEQLAGIMRNIAAQMTVEQLNNDRESFREQVLQEAATGFGKVGMTLDILNVQNISDDNGYIASLGRGRIEQAKAAAAIETANAQRDARIREAEAKQAAAEAEALSATAIANANRDRDLAFAAVQAQVTAEQARATATGQQAEAEAQKAIIAAQVANDRARVEAEIGVEKLRAEKAEMSQRADVVMPAEARRQAAILDAEGRKAAAIADAEASAEKVRLAGAADAAARVANAEADKAEMLARAEGKEAELLAEARGQQALADALNNLTEQAAAQRVLPDLIKTMPEVAAAIAVGLGQIDRMVLINGGGNGEGGDTISRVATMVPMGITAVIEAVRTATGMDVPQLVSAIRDAGAASTPEVEASAK